MKFKRIYEFTIPKKEMVDETEVSTNEQNETVTVTRKVEKEVPRKFALKRPTRSLTDKAELYYHSTLGQLIQAGLIPAALLLKKLEDQGGVLTEREKGDQQVAYTTVYELNLELNKLRTKEKQEGLNDEEQARLKAIPVEIAEKTKALESYALSESALYDSTAESHARTKTILWWTLFLLHSQDARGEWVPFCAGETIEEKLRAYELMEESDEISEEEKVFLERVLRHGSMATAFYFTRGFVSDEELNKVADVK